MSIENKRSDQPSHSGIEDHQIQGKTLVPPFLKLRQLQFNSWINERLPEMVWAALLVSELPRTEALGVFQELAKYAARFRNGGTVSDVTFSSFSSLPPDVLDGALDVLTLTDPLKKSLRPILLLRDLPSK